MTATHDRTPMPDAGLMKSELGRRTFLGYVIGGTTLVAAADMAFAGQSAYAVPSGPSVPEAYDLNDLLTDSCRPTENLITVTINSDGTASFALPRSENGQGIVTSTAMIIAEELELPVDKVKVTLADARPELVYNQLTGGSNTTISTFTPIRVAAAVAKLALLQAASTLLGDSIGSLVAKGGVVQGPSGAIGYGDLAVAAASATTQGMQVQLKDPASYRVVGVGTGRTDARDAVMGKKQYATDLQIAGALPTMVCRAPTLNGTPKALNNASALLAMPGVTDVAVIDTGIAIRAATFGQCIDAVRAVDATWNGGSVVGLSDPDIVAEMRAAQVPMPVVPDVPGVSKTINTDMVFYFRSNSAMDTNSAIADVRPDGAEIWAGLKSPATAQGRIADAIGLPLTSVKVHVVQGGGSFGRRLFFDAALEAAKISKAMGKPVKLMWHRADDARVGRVHPLATSRTQAVVNELTHQVVSFTQLHTSIETDYRHGLGDIITAKSVSTDPLDIGNNVGFGQTVFTLTQEVPYNFGVVAQSLFEPDGSNGTDNTPRFNTSSMRNIYSPDVRTANELTIDQIAAHLKVDPYVFRRNNLRTDLQNGRVLAVLDKVAEVGGWGKSMPAGTAQGIAIHKEYKGASACLVELDCRPQTTGRTVNGSPEFVTGPRVTRVTYAIDAGLVVNPRGLEAQMQGGINDGIAQALTSSLHLKDGHFVEGSWDNYFYTRQWNAAPAVQVIIMPSTGDQPGGAGEAGVAASMAAVACAYARATGTVPTYFPINHEAPLPFVAKPYVPPIPQSPTDGLSYTY